MTLSQEILERIILQATPEADTINKILEVTDISSNGARLGLGVESMASLLKNTLGNIATYDIAALNEELYGNNIQTFTEITADTVGIGRVPVDTPGSPQPQLEGLLLSYGAAGSKVQILAYNTGVLWFRVETGSADGEGQWQNINSGLIDHILYNHRNNANNTIETYYYTIPEAATTVMVRLRSAGGGGGGPVSFQGVFNRGDNAEHSTVTRLLRLESGPSDERGFYNQLTALGGRAGNEARNPTYPNNKETTPLRDSGARLGEFEGYHFVIPGLGEPGGVSAKVINRKTNQPSLRAGDPVIPQDGLPGELLVWSFNPSATPAPVMSYGRLEIRLAPGGRAGNGGYHGKGATAEVIVW